MKLTVLTRHFHVLESKDLQIFMMISQIIINICFIHYCSPNIYLVETEQKSTDEFTPDTSIGYDYMDTQGIIRGKEMVDKREQSVQLGKSANLKCSSTSKISKCLYHTKNGTIIYESRPGISIEGGRITCLCDVRNHCPHSSLIHSLSMTLILILKGYVDYISKV